MLYLCRSNTLCRQGFMQQNLCVGGTGTEKKRDRNKTMIFDTHAHYDDEAFEEDREALIASLAEQGIGRVVNVAADLASVSTSLTLAQQYPFIYAAVGVHPSNVQELTERDYEWLEEKLETPKAVAVGEIGLDYYWDKEPEVQARQRESFSRQLQLAKKLDKKKLKYYYLDGSTKAMDRINLVNDFNNNDEVKVFLISLKAGGTGLNLTSANTVIHFDPWWNMSAQNQATDRAYGLGQTNNVKV